MFQVLDDGKPAESRLSILWTNSIFQHFEDAHKYAKRWVGLGYEDCVPDKPDKKVDYSGRGNIIEIQELKTTLFEILKGKTIASIYDGRLDGSVLIRLTDRTEIIIFHGVVREFDDTEDVIEIHPTKVGE